MYDIGKDAGLTHHGAATDGFCYTLLREVYVDPAGEEIARVPFALAVAEQDQGVVGHGSILPNPGLGF